MDSDDETRITDVFEFHLNETHIADRQMGDDASQEREIPDLAPADGGRAAWRVLLAAFVIEAIFWGLPDSWGIWQQYYSALPIFKHNAKQIALIGTVSQGLVYLGSPFASALARHFPHFQKQQIYVSWTLCILGLVSASFCHSIGGLIITQGVLYGVGFVSMLMPIINMLNEWWIVRKGMAFGIISAASGVAGTVMPFIIDALLHKYGYKTTLRATAGALFVLTAPLLPLLKGRLPVPERSQQPKSNYSFFRKPLFWVYATAMLTHGLGFFMPPVFVPSYAVDIGISHNKAALLLAIMSLWQVLGQFALGWLSDTRLPTGLLTSTCAIMAAIATATLWGFGKSIALLVLYSIFYGFFAYGFGTLRLAMGRAVSNDQTTMLSTYSSFLFLEGIGNILTGPIVAGLLQSGFSAGDYGALRYKAVIAFAAGTSMLAGTIVAGASAIRAGIGVLR